MAAQNYSLLSISFGMLTGVALAPSARGLTYGAGITTFGSLVTFQRQNCRPQRVLSQTILSD